MSDYDDDTYELTGANLPTTGGRLRSTPDEAPPPPRTAEAPQPSAHVRTVRDLAWESAVNVLCVRLDTIGDVLMTTPAIRGFSEAGPRDRRVTLLTSSRGAEVAELVPEIDDVIVYDPPWMKLTEHAPDDPALDRSVIRMLGNRGFDAAAIFTAPTQSPLPAALLCYLAGIPLRLARTKEKAYRLLTHRLPEFAHPEAVHETERQLSLAAAVGAQPSSTALSLGVGGSGSAMEALEAVGMPGGEAYFVVHVGASAPSRRYPAEMFGEAARMFAAATGLVPVFTAGPGEEDLARRARHAARTGHVLTGSSLAVLAEVIASADIIVTGNTGPAHIAAAVQTPVVDVYAMTNPAHEPWQVPSAVLTQRVPCAYCYSSVCVDPAHACLTSISPRRVAEAALALQGSAQTPQKSALSGYFRS